MKKKYLFKSNINVAVEILVCILVYFIFKFIWVLSENNIMKYLIIVLTPVLFYLSLYHLVNKCYFYDNFLEIKYFFRLNNRLIKINYNEIKSVKYSCTDSGYTQPTITIKVKELHNTSKSFSFPLRSYNNRRELLRYLANIGLAVEIDSILDKDQTILL